MCSVIKDYDEKRRMSNFLTDVFCLVCHSAYNLGAVAIEGVFVKVYSFMMSTKGGGSEGERNFG